MSRSDYGKPRNQKKNYNDVAEIGYQGPFLRYISGYNPHPQCRPGHIEDNQGFCHVCGCLLNTERYTHYYGVRTV